MKSKFKQWKEAIKNTPPERLHKINMQGHVLQSISILVVSGILIYTKTMWWLSLIFIFALWNNYSGFVSSYQQYSQIKELRKELDLPEQEIKSPHIKKVLLIKERFGKKAGWISALVSALITYLIIGNFSGSYFLKAFKVVVAFVLMGVFYYITYFIFFYKLTGRLKNV